MFLKILGLLLAYCAIIFVMGKTIGDMTQTDETLLDKFKNPE